MGRRLAFGRAAKKKYCLTNVPFVGKVYTVSKHYGLVRKISVTTKILLSVDQESAVDLHSVDRFP